MGINYELIGQSLRARRKELRLTQTALANKIGVARSYISEIENGNIKNPSLNKIEAIANELGIDIPRLFDKAKKEDFFITDEEKEFLNLYKKLPLETQREIVWEIKGRLKEINKRPGGQS